jgi:hypothetical protein
VKLKPLNVHFDQINPLARPKIIIRRGRLYGDCPSNFVLGRVDAGIHVRSSGDVKKRFSGLVTPALARVNHHASRGEMFRQKLPFRTVGVTLKRM